MKGQDIISGSFPISTNCSRMVTQAFLQAKSAYQFDRGTRRRTDLDNSIQKWHTIKIICREFDVSSSSYFAFLLMYFITKFTLNVWMTRNFEHLETEAHRCRIITCKKKNPFDQEGSMIFRYNSNWSNSYRIWEISSSSDILVRSSSEIFAFTMLKVRRYRYKHKIRANLVN
jgi:hypothetical protein